MQAVERIRIAPLEAPPSAALNPLLLALASGVKSSALACAATGLKSAVGSAPRREPPRARLPVRGRCSRLAKKRGLDRPDASRRRRRFSRPVVVDHHVPVRLLHALCFSLVAIAEEAGHAARIGGKFKRQTGVVVTRAASAVGQEPPLHADARAATTRSARVDT